MCRMTIFSLFSKEIWLDILCESAFVKPYSNEKNKKISKVSSADVEIEGKKLMEECKCVLP